MKNKLIVAITGFLTVLVLVAGYHMTAHPPGNVLAQDADTLPDEPVFDSPEITEDGIELSWGSSSESAGTEFVLYRRVLPYEKLSEYATVPNSGTSRTSFTDTNVEPGLQYLYRLAGVNSAGEGPKSDPERITVPGERLEAPSDLAGAYTEQGIELTWGAPTNAAVTDYQVYRGQFRDDGAGVSKYAKVRADSDPMTYLDANVDQGAKYRYRVAAVNATGEGGKSPWLDLQATSSDPGTVPAAPQVLKGVSTEQGIALTWSPPPGSTVTDYQVYRGIFRDDGAGVSKYATVPADSDPMTYLDTDVDPGVGYRYRVAAVNDAGEGGMSIWADVFVDSPATGAPAITGTAQVGETLEADTSGIADANGLDHATFSYQWLRTDGVGSAPTAGVTGPRYTLAEDDEGFAVQVRVSFTDDHGYDEELTSEPTALVAPPNRPPTGKPTITGTVQVGRILAAVTSGIADADGLGYARFSYQWLRGDQPIAGATESTYTLAEADEGQAIRVRVSFTDDRGHAETLASAPTAAVESAPNSPATGAPTITGTVQVGRTLEADTSGIADEDGPGNATFSYQWLSSDGTENWGIAGATSATYTLVAADEGRTVKVRVSFTDDRGHTETLTSAATAAVEPAANNPATGAPAIYSKPQVGRPLRADTSLIADEDGLANAVFHYQWITNDGTADTEIAGATGVFYTPIAADVGKAVKVTVSFTDDEGNPETLPSAPTVEVVMPPLTANHSEPAPHDGQTAFTFTLWFSEEFKLSYLTLRDHAFTVEGGTVTRARRGQKPSNMLWEIHVQPDSDAAVTIVLPATVDCDSEEAICTEDGRPLSNRLEFTVAGPVEPAPNSSATGAPAISGIVRVGEELTADATDIADEDGLDNVVFSYQWVRSDGNGGTNIQDATGSSYTLTEDDEGQTIRVKVSFTDKAGNAESLTSDPTGVVAAAETVPGRPQHLDGEASAQGIALTWKAPSGSAVTQYVVYRGILQNGSMNGRPMTKHATIPATGEAMEYTDAEVEADVEYRYRVAAVNSSGEGRASGWVDIWAGS